MTFFHDSHDGLDFPLLDNLLQRLVTDRREGGPGEGCGEGCVGEWVFELEYGDIFRPILSERGQNNSGGGGKYRTAYRKSVIWVGHSVEDMHVEPALTVQGDDMLAEARGSIAIPDVREVVIGFEVALYSERLSNYQRSHDAESRQAGGADLSAGRLGAC